MVFVLPERTHKWPPIVVQYFAASTLPIAHILPNHLSIQNYHS